MRSCIIFEGARSVGMVLEDDIRWRDLHLTQICPLHLLGVVTVELSPDSTQALPAVNVCREWGRGELTIKSSGWEWSNVQTIFLLIFYFEM